MLQAFYSGQEPMNKSNGCEFIMRVSPIGVYRTVKNIDLQSTGHLAGKVAELTHRHPLSTYSSGIKAIVIHNAKPFYRLPKRVIRKLV